MAVALARAVYVYGVASHAVAPLFEQPLGAAKATALAWDNGGTRLAVGFANGRLEVWDAVAGRIIRGGSDGCASEGLRRGLDPGSASLSRHCGRIGCAAWAGELLATGSKDRVVGVLDVRSAADGLRLARHKQEVCGLRWAAHEPRSLASGGNDNRLLVWDLASRGVISEFSEHRAAVKAIDWSPHRAGLLASGGGSGDNSVRFWDARAAAGASLRCVDSKAQVCALRWSRNSDEVVVAGGYPKNEVFIIF